MKVQIRIQDKSFEVEVGDLSARPVITTVNGQRIEVWPEQAWALPVGPKESPVPVRQVFRPTRVLPEPNQAPGCATQKAVFAPIPGVIESILIQPGDHVEVGQALCVLEAMKMKNMIRAARSGEIARILVSPGQHVAHHDALMEYTS